MFSCYHVSLHKQLVNSSTCQLVYLPCYFVSLRKQLVYSSTRSLVYLLTMLLCLSSQATCLLVYSFTRLLVNHVTLSLFASNLFTRLTCQLVNFRKDNSQTENQKGTNSVRINALWACKRCPLRPLLTPFWNLTKHL